MKFLARFIAPALILMSSCTFAVQFAHADAFGLDDTAKGTVVFKDAVKEKKTLPTLIGDLLGVALSLVGLVFLGFAVYGGFRWMTAQGDSKSVQEGRDTLINATIGVILVMSAYVVTNFLFTNVADQITSPTAAPAEATAPPAGG